MVNPETGPLGIKKSCLLTQIVNSLTVKMEIGALMVTMYLLNTPDHYTNHKFCSFYWKNYVFEARQSWLMGIDNQ